MLNDASDPHSLVWHLTTTGADEILLTQKPSGLVLTIAGPTDGVRPTLEKPNDQAGQIWRITSPEEGIYVLINKASGKALEVYQGDWKNGGLIDQWDFQNVEHHLWLLEQVK